MREQAGNHKHDDSRLGEAQSGQDVEYDLANREFGGERPVSHVIQHLGDSWSDAEHQLLQTLLLRKVPARGKKRSWIYLR